MREEGSVGMTGEVHTVPEGWREMQQKGVPPVSWDASAKRYVVALRGAKVELTPTGEANDGIDIHIQPPALYKLNIRKVGESDWGAGLVLPFHSVTVGDLAPDTEYELKIAKMDLSGNMLPEDAIVQRLDISKGIHEPST